MELRTGNNGRELTDDDLNKWVESFPVEPIQAGWPRVVLPSEIFEYYN
ncbi:MAG: hypothetical protein ABSH32_32595 [Bryobacteraceae bacterium]